jgi:hypothetical protein
VLQRVQVYLGPDRPSLPGRFLSDVSTSLSESRFVARRAVKSHTRPSYIIVPVRGFDGAVRE